jgi:hypothetical protein
MASTVFLAGYYGLRLDASEAFIQGYVDGMRLDQRGQGVACGKGWIPVTKHCSPEKARQTSKEAKARTVEKAKARQQLRAQVRAAKGQKARNIGESEKMERRGQMTLPLGVKSVEQSGQVQPQKPAKTTPKPSTPKGHVPSDFSHLGDESLDSRLLGRSRKVGSLVNADGDKVDVAYEAAKGQNQGNVNVSLREGKKTIFSAPFSKSHKESMAEFSSRVEDYFRSEFDPGDPLTPRLEINPPSQAKPDRSPSSTNRKKKNTTVKRMKGDTPAGNGTLTGDAQRDMELSRLREAKKQSDAGGRGLTFAQETALERSEAMAKADPGKWKPGQGVGYRVLSGGKGTQVNRGFRVMEVDAETKLALVGQVADTGLTSSGGNDRFAPSWVHVADLVTDKKYSRRDSISLAEALYG